MTELLCKHCGQTTVEFSGIDVTTLTRVETRIVEALAAGRHRLTPIEVLIDAVYGDRPDGGPLNAAGCLKVRITSLRPKLASSGWTIENKHSLGYRLTPLSPETAGA